MTDILSSGVCLVLECLRHLASKGESMRYIRSWLWATAVSHLRVLCSIPENTVLLSQNRPRSQANSSNSIAWQQQLLGMR